MPHLPLPQAQEGEGHRGDCAHLYGVSASKHSTCSPHVLTQSHDNSEEESFCHGLPVRSCTSGGRGEVGGHGRVRTRDGVCLCPEDTVPLCNLGAVCTGSSGQQGTNTSQSAPHLCSHLSLRTHGRLLHKYAGGALLTASGVGRSLVGSVYQVPSTRGPVPSTTPPPGRWPVLPH